MQNPIGDMRQNNGERKNIIGDKGHLRRNFKTRGNVTAERKGRNMVNIRFGTQKYIYILPCLILVNIHNFITTNLKEQNRSLHDELVTYKIKIPPKQT